MLGADHVVATRMEEKDGRYTGQIRYYAYAENKAKAIADLARKRGYDLARSYAYSDSITDLSMLEAVGHPHAVNPDKDLRRAARERDWPVLVFDKPVALQSRLRLPPARPTLTALAVGGAMAVAGFAWAELAPAGAGPDRLILAGRGSVRRPSGVQREPELNSVTRGTGTHAAIPLPTGS